MKPKKTFLKDENTISDIDGNFYKIVKIGTQVWTAENLNVSHYRNGDIIPQVKYPDEWSKLTTGAWCYYNNDSENSKTYGKLYNWYAVNDPRGLAPEGWHIPTNAEWKQLEDYLGGEKIAGGKLKATTLWESPNKGATNESGFTAIPGGYRFFDGYFNNVGNYGYFWSSSEFFSDFAWFRYLYYNRKVVNRKFLFKSIGMSVRCLVSAIENF